MRDHSNHRSAPRHKAVAALLGAWEFERPHELVPVAEACGRVAGRTVRSRNTLPNTWTSNMDAVCVRFDELPADGSLPDTSTWVRGRDWQFCNTGVAVPDGFDTAIRIEDVEVAPDAQTMRLLAVPAHKHACTSEPGSTLQPDDLLVRAGEVLTPVKLAVLGMGGHTEVDVVRKPRVAFIPTGNELVDATDQVPRGKNVESNAAMICSKVAAWGGEPVRFPIVPDDPDRILAALREATASCDIVVINAGSSKGSDDFTCEILEREGEVLFHEVEQGPGKHCSFSLLDAKPVVGISGPPIGAEFTADFFVKPFVDAFLGANLDWPPTVTATMLDDNPMQPRRSDVVKRVALRREPDGGFVAWSVSLPERPALRFCDDANALVVVDRDSCGWRAGDRVEVELRWPYTLPPLR
jgi:molybdenum cofactor synthesis domain-containing protein